MTALEEYLDNIKRRRLANYQARALRAFWQTFFEFSRAG